MIKLFKPSAREQAVLDALNNKQYYFTWRESNWTDEWGEPKYEETFEFIIGDSQNITVQWISTERKFTVYRNGYNPVTELSRSWLIRFLAFKLIRQYRKERNKKHKEEEAKVLDDALGLNQNASDNNGN